MIHFLSFPLVSPGEPYSFARATADGIKLGIRSTHNHVGRGIEGVVLVFGLVMRGDHFESDLRRASFS